MTMRTGGVAEEKESVVLVESVRQGLGYCDLNYAMKIHLKTKQN